MFIPVSLNRRSWNFIMDEYKDHFIWLKRSTWMNKWDVPRNVGWIDQLQLELKKVEGVTAYVL